jgi:type III secretion control protein HpaP
MPDTRPLPGVRPPPRTGTGPAGASRAPGGDAADAAAALSPRFSELLKQRKPPAEASQAPPLPRVETEETAELAVPLPTELPEAPVLPVARVTPATRHLGARDADAADDAERPAPAVTAAGPLAGLDRDGRRMVDSVSDAVSRFCNNEVVSDGGSWQVSMPMREDVLPRTELDLSLSPQSLSLRFRARDERAFHLLSQCQPELVHAVGEALQRRREVSVSVE